MPRFIQLVTLLLINLTVFSAAHAQRSNQETAILAGGCFWCVESDYEKLDGVIDVVSGYIGGHVENPTYKQVSTGSSGHIEAARIVYDPSRLSYEAILDYFYRHIDPTNNKGQFCDFGPQYRPAIFYLDDQQQTIARASLLELDNTKPFTDPVRIELLEATRFYPAEDFHQDYYKKNPVRYKFYRYSCGRDARVEALWGSAPTN